MFDEDGPDESLPLSVSAQNFHGYTEKAFQAEEAERLPAADPGVSTEDLERIVVALQSTPENVALGATARTLREMLLAAEPWNSTEPYPPLTPGLRRLQEKRANRTLGVVADWLLGRVEANQGDEMTLVVLLELAENIRRQIEWPEREAHEAVNTQGSE